MTIARPTPLIAAADLARALGDPRLVLLDIRSAVDGGGRAAYLEGHVPGAIHTDYVTGGWRVKRGAGAGMLPEPDALARLLGSLGIRPDSEVVVIPAGVSAGDFAAASRVYWTLKAAGHGAVRMLDGGFSGWRAARHPVETGPGREPAAAGPYPVQPDAAIRATLAHVEQTRTGGGTLVDTRNAASYLGEERSPLAARAGRIPGAIHQEGAVAYDPAANRLKPPDELERLFGGLPDGEVVPYCNSGQQAATNWFVLSEMLGRPGVRLYDGSLSEWTADPDRPVATGPG